MIINEKILKNLNFIKVDIESNFLSKYINFLLLDDCLRLSFKIEDKKEKEYTEKFLIEHIKENINLLQKDKDKNKIQNISLDRKDLHYLDDYTFRSFEYKLSEIKKNNLAFLDSYLKLICD